jgi:GDP/UDP-N,N'-diacetylbacillosamine 2-epimerase (hydrolysing)
MKKKLCFITGSRADYGPIRYFLKKIKKNSNFIVQIIVTGSHLSKEFGYSINEIKQDGFKINKKININSLNKLSLNTAQITGKLIQLISPEIKKLNPNLVVLFGDRYETFAAAFSASSLRVPILHICGGDITTGSLDNIMRHSITKMSNLHFVTNEFSKKVVINLGENPKSVFNTGSLGTEEIKKLKLLKKEKLQKIYNFKLANKNLLITYHPDSILKKNYKSEISKIFLALKKFPDIFKIFTAANADENGNEVNNLIKKFVNIKSNNSIFIPNMGNLNYLSILKYIDAVLGNSSSGIYEVPSFKKATINLGDRQKGRLIATSIINSKIETNEIVSSIKKIYTKSFKKKLKKTLNPYSGKNVSNKMVKILNNYDFFKYKKNI